MKAPAALALAILTAGCAGPTRPDPPPVLTRIELTAAQTATVEAKVKEKLKDPYSAVFGKRVAGRNEHGTTVVCGLVNAKNGFGGYTGMSPYQAYISGSGTIEVHTIDTNPGGAALTYQACSGQGLPIGP